MAKSRSSSPKWLIGALVTSLAVGAGYGGYRMFGSGQEDADRTPVRSNSQVRSSDSPAQEWLERASGQQNAPSPQKQQEPSRSPLSFPTSLFGGGEKGKESKTAQVVKKKNRSKAKASKYGKKSKKRGIKSASWKKSKKKKTGYKKTRKGKSYAKSKHKKSKYAKKYKSKKNRKISKNKKKTNKKMVSYKRTHS